MARIRNIRWGQILLILGFGLSLAITVFFVVRILHQFPHRRSDEPIRPWMSVPYVGRSYHIPASVLFQALGLPNNPRDRRPISVIAREQKRSIDSTIAILRDAIIQARPGYPPPPTLLPDPTRGSS